MSDETERGKMMWEGGRPRLIRVLKEEQRFLFSPISCLLPFLPDSATCRSKVQKRGN
jgi:hypothetical protein